MFSPSLVAMMFQGLASFDETPAINENGLDTILKSHRDAVSLMRQLELKYAKKQWPKIPVIIRATVRVDFDSKLDDSFSTDAVDGVYYRWGRVSLSDLITLFSDFWGIEPERFYADLGTPLCALASGSTQDLICNNLLEDCAPNAKFAKIGVAIVDLSKASTGLMAPPDNYQGQLRHALTANVEMSDHAEKVLSVLLSRLDQYGLLPDVTVSCALVEPPKAGLIAANADCFDQANSTEMLDAVKALVTQLDDDNLPAVVNLSLGTHVGPHNGDSPFEDYIHSKLFQSGRRFVFAAAGNDGGKGLAAKRTLIANEQEFVRLHTGPRCKNLLLEFWWDDSLSPTIDAEVKIYAILPTGERALRSTIDISSALFGNTLTKAPAGLPRGVLSQAIFHGKCRNNLSCIAFALSTSQSNLPPYEIRFGLKSSKDVVVNGWIVVNEIEPETAFKEGGPDGTINVPATDSNVLSVAGLDPTPEMWEGSSRGPAASYKPSGVGEKGLHLAHNAKLENTRDRGTSFASPRACGDAARVLVDPKRLASCLSAFDLLCETYGLKADAPWNPRFGYHKAS